MPGKAYSRAMLEAQQRRLQEARELPTPERTDPPDYSDDLIPELFSLAALGLSFSEIAAHWAIDEETFFEWGEAHDTFERATRRARTLAKAWWQRQSRLAIAEQNSKFPAGAWSHVMRAMFPEYDDKPSLNVAVSVQSKLVHVHMYEAERPELPGEQSVGGPNPLIEHGTGKLAGSLPGRNGAETPALEQDAEDGPPAFSRGGAPKNADA